MSTTYTFASIPLRQWSIDGTTGFPTTDSSTDMSLAITLVTDGTIGLLSNANIVSWSWAVTGTTSFSASSTDSGHLFDSGLNLYAVSSSHLAFQHTPGNYCNGQLSLIAGNPSGAATGVYVTVPDLNNSPTSLVAGVARYDYSHSDPHQISSLYHGTPGAPFV